MAFLKVFGLVLAGFVVFFAGMIGYLFATGGFNPPYIPPTGLSFSEQEYIIDEDTDIFLLPTPEDATELDVQLSILTGSGIIRVPQTAKMNEPITVEVLKDGNENNIGGVARLRANQGLLVTECVIYVDVVLDSFTIGASNEGSIYVGENFTVSPTNVYPQYALNPTVLNANYNLDDKVVKYYSSNEAVALVDELTGEVTPLGEGEFEIEARVIKTYNLVEEEPNILDFEYEEDYWAEMDLISVVATRTFTVSSIAVAGIEVLDDVEDPLYELDLHKTHIFTPSDFGLKLLPQQDSAFTSEQLNYKLKDLEIIVSNENVLQVVQTDEPLSYAITVVTFETWQIKQTNIIFKYSDDYEAIVHFKILRNDITGITIAENAQNAIEVILDPLNQETFDLEANTTIQAVDPSKPATYTTLMYKIDLAQKDNDLDELIIDIDEETGYVTDNIITPLHRGTTRLKAFVIETDITGEPILDTGGNYIVMFEMTEYVTVNVLEQLTNLQVAQAAVLKTPKDQTIIVGEELHIIIENYYDATVYAQMSSIQANINALLLVDTSGYSQPELEAHNYQIFDLEEQLSELKLVREIDVVGSSINLIDTAFVLEENKLTIRLQGAQEGKSNVFIMDTASKMFVDYVEVNVISGTPEIEPIEFTFDMNTQVITSLIRGTEGFFIFSPNSYGAFIDAYKYGKLEFISTNQTMIQIYSTIDVKNNVIVKLVAIGFSEDPDLSFSMIRIKLIDASINDYLINRRVNIDIGAVNDIYIHVNSTTITAVPDEAGTQWLTPTNDPLSAWVTFNNPENPAVIGVQYISMDTSILEIDNTIIDEFGNPKFTFKKPGNVILVAKSLDPYAIDTTPDVLGIGGAYSYIPLTVTAPTVVDEFYYSNYVNGYEQIVAGDSIDLLLKEISDGGSLHARVKIKRSDGVDYTSLADFKLEMVTPAATLVEVPKNELFNIDREVNINSNLIGVTVQVRVHIYTDFGYETYYNIRIVPDIETNNQVNYPDNGNPLVPNLPEVVYPPTEGTLMIDLLAQEVMDTEGLTSRVNIRDRSGVLIPVGTGTGQVQFEVNNIAFGIVGVDGKLTINKTSVERNLEVRIFIEYASGIDFETYYNITVVPNIQINATYSNTVTYNDYEYESIGFAGTYDLIATGKISAYTVDPAISPADDISDVLLFTLRDSNDYIAISETGELSYLQPITEDQYISIRVYTNYDYFIIYRVRIEALTS